MLIDTATCSGKYTEHGRHCSGLPADCSLPICRGPKQYTPARYLDFAHALRLKAHKLTTELGERGNPATTLPCSHLSMSYNSLLAVCIHACTHVHKANQHLQQTHPEMFCKLAAMHHTHATGRTFSARDVEKALWSEALGQKPQEKAAGKRKR